MIEELRELAEEAKAAGLAVVVWSYPRGGALSKAGETAVDVCAYAAQIAALLGAHVIKVKPPTGHGGAERGAQVLRRGRDRRLHPAGAGRARRPVGFRWAPAGGVLRRLGQGQGGPVRRGPRRPRRRRGPGRSSAATPSSARAARRWRCWTRSSPSTGARRERGGAPPPLPGHAERAGGRHAGLRRPAGGGARRRRRRLRAAALEGGGRRRAPPAPPNASRRSAGRAMSRSSSTTARRWRRRSAPTASISAPRTAATRPRAPPSGRTPSSGSAATTRATAG